MTRTLVLLAALSACAPKDPTGTDSAGDSEAGTGSTVAMTTGGEVTTGVMTTGVVTTGDGSTTMALPVCKWDDPVNHDYCPLLAAPNIDITADTPMGPVTFKYAYFGMELCNWCPDPWRPTLGLFAQEQTSGLDALVGDYVQFNDVEGKYATFEGMIGGQPVESGIGTVLDFPELVRATEEQTMPPLDPDVAPTMVGKISFIGGGWMLVGEFTASLCTTLNYFAAPCE